MNETPDDYLCECGYSEGSFACRIRHVGVFLPNSEARRHDQQIRAERQEQIYGV